MHDTIIVGARCAGASTALLLARQGFKVLLVDRATFPSDTISTHICGLMAPRSWRQSFIVDELLVTGDTVVGVRGHGTDASQSMSGAG